MIEGKADQNCCLIQMVPLSESREAEYAEWKYTICFSHVPQYYGHQTLPLTHFTLSTELNWKSFALNGFLLSSALLYYSTGFKYVAIIVQWNTNQYFKKADVFKEKDFNGFPKLYVAWFLTAHSKVHLIVNFMWITWNKKVAYEKEGMQVTQFHIKCICRL